MSNEVENTTYSGNTYEEPLKRPLKIGKCGYCKEVINNVDQHIEDSLRDLLFCGSYCFDNYIEEDE